MTNETTLEITMIKPTGNLARAREKNKKQIQTAILQTCVNSVNGCVLSFGFFVDLAKRLCNLNPEHPSEPDHC